MRKLLNLMNEKLSSGEDLVLVTVVASSGATPRGAGARMLIGKSGRLYGTIGGGAVEYRSMQIASRVLEDKSSLHHDFSLTKDDVQKLGMICGGAVNVFFHYIHAGDKDVIALTAEAERGFAEGKEMWLASDLGGEGRLFLCGKDNCPEYLRAYLTRHPKRVQQDGCDVFIEQINSSGRVYIFGGGHVAQELEPVLTHVGFRCVVLDDRSDFTKPELFPTAEEIKLIDFNRISDFVTLTESDYVCVMTRGHAFDTVVQAQVIKAHPCYIGVIGSSHKAAGVRKVLSEEYGISDEELALVTTPIGLEIAAETPAEIAVSIAAQMIAVRAGLNEQDV